MHLVFLVLLIFRPFRRTGLLARGASVSVVNEDGDTALSLAKKRGHVAMVTLLRNHL